jgi:hypothetical protein
MNDDTCQQCVSDPDCDDNDVCNGAETCVGNNCVAGTPLTCDDGLYCNGAETCDPALGCQAASNPCPETDCNHCNETDDSCFDSAGSACLDDGLYCTGAEECDGAGACVSAGDPCPDTDCNHCNENDDSCFDSVGSACLDDGQYCTGTEECDGAGACVSSGDPCPDTECNHCNEADNNCFDAIGIACTDDGAYCNGPERCDGAGSCTGAGNPCLETECNTCQEDVDDCFDLAGTVCLDDGLYCNGVEECDGAGACVSAGDPCPDTDCNHCNEADDSCFDALGTACLDDGLYCTGLETCDGAGACASAGDPCPATLCNTCQEDLDNCFDPPTTSCDDGLYCTATDNCDGAGNCTGSGSPCQGAEVCIESTDTCQLSNCTSQPDCTPCNDGLYCTAEDNCLAGVCTGSGYPCAAGEVCNEGTDTCEPGCATDCSSLTDACNTGVCNPQSSQCELLPKSVGTFCAPNGGSNYIYCHEGVCTHFCNHSYMVPGDPDHECPVGFGCEALEAADSAGYCLRNPGGTKMTGEECEYSPECRSNFCDGTLDPYRCIDACSTVDDCRNTGPDTGDWTCHLFDALGPGGGSRGYCYPAPGNGRTGDDCSGWSDCRDGFCPNGKCADMCCTEAECPAPYVCWPQNGRRNSSYKVCEQGLRGPGAPRAGRVRHRLHRRGFLRPELHHRPVRGRGGGGEVQPHLLPQHRLPGGLRVQLRFHTLQCEHSRLRSRSGPDPRARLGVDLPARRQVRIDHSADQLPDPAKRRQHKLHQLLQSARFADDNLHSSI